MSDIFATAIPLIDIVGGLKAALAWVVPVIAVFFLASWGIRTVFGRRR